MNNLFPHNQQAVNAVLDHYSNGHKKAAVVHATGTGKSYIIAAVVEHYNKCLVIAPNDYVLAETQKLCKRGTEFITYIAAMFGHAADTDYDLIVLDEYHRAGAPEWGAAVQKIISNNPNARLLGTTATDVRYLDALRNMSDELFDGNVVSRISLAEAWVRNILIPPVYVTGLYTFDEIARNIVNRYCVSPRYVPAKEAQLISAIEGIRLDWMKAGGLNEIFRKHLRQDTKRVIVFCEHIKHISDVMTQSVQWFANAGFKVFKTYSVNFENRQSDNELADFERDGYEGIKVMFSINMLNEGIHVPNVDAVVMLRPTSSKIIHLQQIGRCMTTNNKKQPVIFDLVDNLENSSVIQYIYNDYIDLKNRTRTNEKREHESFDFIIEDYVQPIHDIIKTLEDKFFVISFEQKMKEIEEWCELNGRYPVGCRKLVSEMTRERNIEQNYYAFLYRNRHREEVIALKKKYATFSYMPFEYKFNALSKWVTDNGRMPHQYRGSTANLSDERRTEYELALFVLKNRDNADIVALSAKYVEFRTLPEEDKARLIEDWCAEHNALPVGRRNDRYERTLSRHIFRHANEPFYIALRKQYNYKSPEEMFNENKKALLDFCNEHGRLPSQQNEKEKSLYNFFRSCQRRKDLDWINELYKKYVFQSDEASDLKRIELIREFCIKNNRVPSAGRNEMVEGEKIIHRMYCRLRNHPEVIVLRKKYSSSVTRTRIDSDMRQYRDIRRTELIDFVERNGFLPRHTEGQEKILANYWSRFRDDDEVAKRIYSQYPFYMQYSLMQGIERVKEFIRINHRTPTRKCDEQYLRDVFSKQKLRNNPEIIELLNQYQNEQ